MSKTPVEVATTFLEKNKGKNAPLRLMIGTPTLGQVRIEWVSGRYGQTIPTNFSTVDVQQVMSSYAPINFQVADSENLIAKVAVENGFEWLLMWEDDNIPPYNALTKINEYMIRGDIPIVGGLYFTKSVPPEPIMYRGMGMGYYADWKLGDKVWVDGLPFGFTLINGKVLKAVWDESSEYVVGGITTRRVFDTPSDSWVDPETNGWMNRSGTSDLEFFSRLKRDRILEKAGFPEYQEKEFPYLVDTTIFVKHIDRQNGTQYPIDLPTRFLKGELTFKDALKEMTN